MNDIITAERRIDDCAVCRRKRSNRKKEKKYGEEKKTDFHEKYRKKNQMIKSNIVLCIM